ncbi:MAG: hypothetical protein KDA57_09495 [Planctomycetales bacterium]|nr:hypothetical protein [Planctomycetales bacterium]
MDEKDKKSAWDDLAQELGAQPSSEAFERHQPPPVELTPADDLSSNDDAPSAPVVAGSDWNALANMLGIQVPAPTPPVEEVIASSKPAEQKPAQEPVERPRSRRKQRSTTRAEAKPDEESLGLSPWEVDSEEETLAETLPPLPSEVDQIMSEDAWDDEQDAAEAQDETVDESEEARSTGMSGEAARNAFDALFSAEGSAVSLAPFQPTREGLPLAGDDDSLGFEEQYDEPVEDDETRPKRRRSRRRRRGRGGRRAETEVPSSEQEVGEEEDQVQEGDSGDSGQELSTEEARPRRRRSRRRSRRSSTADDPTKVVDSESVRSADEEDSFEDEGSSERYSKGHRNMPTWAEALSIIVEANLEQRSKSPNKPNTSRGRGRGGRRRG